ncbi:hypothetical protein Q2T40_16875 [Winogradskyella maritima]|uniref:Uncharacterized protein n=1 Tax=Winogradskyella maritima TaxID=1517766 RepID=A0ABV8AIT9_9FLAO|nr:hypothetical protein [Winogradskyella maritima]
MNRIVFVGLCLVGLAIFLFAQHNSEQPKKVEHKIVKAEVPENFR